LWIAAAAVLLPAVPAGAVKVGDITHLQGSRINRLVGMGIVVGLNGTGDGGKYVPTMRALAQAHHRFANPILTLDELKDARNVALVEVEATLPRDGAREGDQVDVRISSIGAAKSLAGGRLLPTPLVGPHPDDPRGVMALAGGPLQVEDPELPTAARIAQGATLEQNWIHNYVALGQDLEIYRTRGQVRPLHWLRPDEPYVTFVIDEPVAEWSVATAIAQAINEESSVDEVASGNTQDQIAMAFDPRTVVVRVPAEERAYPAPFLARLESLQLFMPFTEARVTIHRSSGSIVITGDVEIAPAVITHKGLTITTLVPEPPPNPNMPREVETNWLALNPHKKPAAKLQDLVDALTRLRIPAEDRITIIEQLNKTGKLYARVIVED
jgi:flagellar P-ring protein precursor FlgI